MYLNTHRLSHFFRISISYLAALIVSKCWQFFTYFLISSQLLNFNFKTMQIVPLLLAATNQEYGTNNISPFIVLFCHPGAGLVVVWCRSVWMVAKMLFILVLTAMQDLEVIAECRVFCNLKLICTANWWVQFHLT